MLYRNKYVVPSIRLKRWDYRSPGWYFVTICVNDRWKQPFGYIHNGFVCVSDMGVMAHRYWLDIPNHFNHVSLDVFVIMPDHVHGIIRIHDDRSVYHNLSVETCHGMSLRNDSILRTDTIKTNVSVQITTRQYNAFSKPIKQSIPMIINQYKSAVTRWCHHHNQPFQWQPRYYEKIIRSHRELSNVRRYILNNPTRWHG